MQVCGYFFFVQSIKGVNLEGVVVALQMDAGMLARLAD